MSLQSITDTAASLWGVWLMILFIGIVGWVFWPKHKQKFESYGSIPLNDDDPEN